METIKAIVKFVPVKGECGIDRSKTIFSLSPLAVVLGVRKGDEVLVEYTDGGGKPTGEFERGILTKECEEEPCCEIDNRNIDLASEGHTSKLYKVLGEIPSDTLWIEGDEEVKVRLHVEGITIKKFAVPSHEGRINFGMVGDKEIIDLEKSTEENYFTSFGMIPKEYVGGIKKVAKVQCPTCGEFNEDDNEY